MSLKMKAPRAYNKEKKESNSSKDTFHSGSSKLRLARVSEHSFVKRIFFSFLKNCYALAKFPSVKFLNEH